MPDVQRNYQLFIDSNKTVDFNCTLSAALWFDTLNMTFSPPLKSTPAEIAAQVGALLSRFWPRPYQNLASSEANLAAVEELWTQMLEQLSKWDAESVFEFNQRVTVRIVPLKER